MVHEVRSVLGQTELDDRRHAVGKGGRQMRFHKPTVSSFGFGCRANAVLSMVVCCALASAAAAAPDIDTIDVRIDKKTDRTSDLRRDYRLLTEETPTEFTFSISLPFTRNGDPAQDDTDRASWHFDPEFTLDWKRQFTSVPLKLSARIDTDMDRYTRDSSNDSDALYAFANAYFTKGGKDAVFVPYVGYRHTEAFAPTYDSSQAKLNDFYAGFVANLSLGASDLTIDAQGGRRESSAVSSNYAKLKATLSCELSAQWSLNVIPQLALRWFDDVAGFDREDVTPQIIAYVAYTPDVKFLGTAPEIDFTFLYLKSDSNKAAADFDTWDIGPSIGLGWKF